MKRLVVLLLLGILAPIVSAQSRPRIVSLSVDPGECPALSEAHPLRRGLVEAGWDPQRTITIERRCFQEYGQLRGIVHEIVASRPAVIVVGGPAVFTLKEMVTTIPVVFWDVGDPVQYGIVATLARPGGNFTGFAGLANQLNAKRLDILREILPALTRVGILANPDYRPHVPQIAELKQTATKLGVTVTVYEARNRPEVETAIRTMSQAGEKALLVLPDAAFLTLRAYITESALKHRLPCAAPFADFVAAGGLFSYAADYSDMGRRVAGYVDRILKGEKPAELPVQQPTKFVFTINMKTAKALEVTIPGSILLRADRVVE